MTTAHETFDAIASLVEAHLQPPERAAKTAATFRQLAKLLAGARDPLPLTLADARTAFSQLAEARFPDEPDNITGRRKTCGEIAELIPGETCGYVAPMIRVLEYLDVNLRDSEDPRHRAIRDTARREAAELRVLRFPWADREQFRAMLLSLHGSDDVHGARMAPTDPQRADALGRYARTYTLGSPGAPGWGDEPGRTASFLVGPNKARPDGVIGPIALTSCPWGTAAEVEATYRYLAECGVLANDAARDPELRGISDAARLAAARSDRQR